MPPSSPMKRGRREIAKSPVLLDADRTVSQLNQAVTAASRLKVLSDLFQQLGYDSKSRACLETDSFALLVEAGAVNALCLQLGFVLNKRDTSPSAELEYICQALELLYRCPDQIREMSLREIGGDLIPLLLKAIKRGTAIVRLEIFSTLHLSARCNTGMVLLSKCRGLMAAATTVLRGDERCTKSIMNVLGLLKILTFGLEECRVHLLEEPGLLTCLHRLPFTFDDEKIMERTSSVFRNLAATPSVRVVLAQNKDMIAALIRLANQDNPRITRNMLFTLDCLTMESNHCVAMVMNGDGLLLNVLKRLLAEDADQVVRRRAARALRHLACDKAIPLLINDTDLMDTLSFRALHDSTPEVRIEAAKAFASCAAFIRAPMPQHAAILESLTNLATERTLVPEVVAKALKEQALHPLNRVPMAEHMGLLEALATIATRRNGSLAEKEYATSALYELSTEEVNREKMVTTAVLEALVVNVREQIHENRNTVIRDQSMKALLNLATIESNRKRMVIHDGLLKALVQYAATAPEQENKGRVKKVIMALVPLL